MTSTQHTKAKHNLPIVILVQREEPQPGCGLCPFKGDGGGGGDRFSFSETPYIFRLLQNATKDIVTIEKKDDECKDRGRTKWGGGQRWTRKLQNLNYNSTLHFKQKKKDKRSSGSTKNATSASHFICCIWYVPTHSCIVSGFFLHRPPPQRNTIHSTTSSWPPPPPPLYQSISFSVITRRGDPNPSK